MIWIILIIVGIVALILLGRKSDSDPHFHMWQLVDTTTERWKNYCEYMKKITSDTLLALELQKKVLIDGKWKRFYRWVSDWDLFHKLDYWDLPDEVWKRGTCDCDGFARFVADVLGRFVMAILKLITEVHWMEYYGFYRKYSYNEETGEFTYKIIAGGHAICVYKKDGELLAFSNTSWWHDLNFKNYIEIGEQTFPEGLYWVISRNWETGVMEWQEKAKEGEILEGTNIFHRKLKLIRNLKPLKRGERRKVKRLGEMRKHA
ncbi:hypothetical protein ES703_82376 [subsurface metagenome]